MIYMPIKQDILKKINAISSEAEALKDDGEFLESVRKYKEGINLLRSKVKNPEDQEDKEDEIRGIESDINLVYSSQIKMEISKAEMRAQAKDFNKALGILNDSIKITEWIEDPVFKDMELSEIKGKISEIEIKKFSKEGEVLRENENLDESITVLEKALKLATSMYDTEPEDSEITNIKNLLNQTFTAQIVEPTNEGNKLIQENNPDAAISAFKKGFNITKKMYDSPSKESEVSKLRDLTNEAYSLKLKSIIEMGAQMIEKNDENGAIIKLKNAFNIALNMFDSISKENEIDKIRDKLNPIYIKRIIPLIERGNSLKNEESFQSSTTKVGNVVKIYNAVLDIANDMIDSQEKEDEINRINTLINEISSTGTGSRTEKALHLIDEKKYEEAIGELYSALSIAKKKADNEGEIDDIKRSVNKVYSAQIADVIEEGNEKANQKNYDEAIEIINGAMKITNQMYLSDEMDWELERIKKIIQDIEVKKFIADGNLTVVRKQFSDRIEKIQTDLQKANKIEDPEKKDSEIVRLKAEIDEVYSDEIRLLLEESDQKIEKKGYNEASTSLESALKVTENIGNKNLKIQEIKNIIDSVLNVGKALLGEEEHDEGFKQFEKALTITKKIDKKKRILIVSSVIDLFKQELNTKAKIDVENGEFNNPINLCNRAIELDNDYVNSYLNLGNAYIGKKEFDTAIKTLNQGVEIDPDFENLWNAIGFANERKAEYDDAIKAYKRAIEIKGNYAQAWYNMGTSYKLKNELNEAIDSYKKAIEIDSSLANAWLFLGTIYFDQLEYNLAIETIDKAIELDENIGNVLSSSIKNLKELRSSIKGKLSELFDKR